jgi:hypothetical protein
MLTPLPSRPSAVFQQRAMILARRAERERAMGIKRPREYEQDEYEEEDEDDDFIDDGGELGLH